jgi:hypothetical protein
MGEAKKNFFRTASSLAIVVLLVVSAQPANANSIAKAIHLHVAFGADRSNSFLSWIAPAGLKLSKDDLAHVQVKNGTGAWQTKVKVPWWQSVINISTWDRSQSFARVFYSSGSLNGEMSEEIDLSNSRQLLESFRDVQSEHFIASISPKNLKLEVSWLKPDFEENWNAHAQSPVFLQATVSFASKKYSYNLPVNSPDLSITIPKANLNSKFDVSAKFVYQNGVNESVKTQVSYVTPTQEPTPKKFLFSKIAFGSSYDTCVIVANAANSSGQQKSSRTAKFKVTSDSFEPFSSSGTLNLIGKTGVFFIAATVSYGGVVKTASTAIEADGKSGFCKKYIGAKEPTKAPSNPGPPKMNMPLKMTWPAIINSTAIEPYRLSIETRVAMSGFTCKVVIGPHEKFVTLDKFGMGSLTFTGQELFFLPQGSLGSISGSCENAKYKGSLPVVIMKKTESPGSSWYLIQAG